MRWGAGCRAALLALAIVTAGCAPRVLQPPPPVAIAAVQGSGPASPMLGQGVGVEGVVTATFDGALGGVFIESTRDDGDRRSSEGLFVATPVAPLPKTGDLVRADGIVRELGAPGASLTAVEATSLAVLGRAPLPAPIPVSAPEDWEALEGMRVVLTVPLTVSGNDQLLRFGELTLAFGDRLLQPTEVHPPGPQADALAAANAQRTLLLDDGRLGEYPSVFPMLPQPLSARAPLRAGSRIDALEAVVEQRFGRYRLQPLAPLRISQAPRPPPPPRAGALRVAAFNVLNLFNGDGRGGGFPTARGARSAEEYQRQLAKLVAALARIDADILALTELENDGDDPHASAAVLARELDAVTARAVWRSVPAPAPGGDAIRVGLLYRSDRVQPVGTTAQIDHGPFSYGSRPPLAQAFDVGAGNPLVLAVNHFKSKGGCDAATGADVDRGDHQACFNAARVAAADALAEWLAGDPTGTGSDRVLLLGDFNAYAEEDPIRRLRAHGYRDVFAGTGSQPLHSFVFRGQAGRLDHALGSAAVLPLVAAAAVWHANADESDAFGYRHLRDGAPVDGFRASDHDPLLVDLAVPAAAVPADRPAQP